MVSQSHSYLQRYQTQVVRMADTANTTNTNNEETSRARGWLVLKHHMLTHKVGWQS